ncbi:Protein of unknown function DUF58 [Ruegeria intermedia]|uniref:DUF58 domain-containing protein n=1 Tax=Ruegeria intermedia TaxID=996115 RepID=A0A1M4T8I6_9RHOB|nr:DUF58 domain-containing protein [Ruegeria intermedia]SHE40823.1 Protein of unknown function DUF58 [Ruegeria intermedia]
MSPTAATSRDTRIHVDARHLLSLGGRSGALSLLPRQPARSVLNGRHASRLRGRGLNFEELRTYLPGDDIRTIDWKVTARTGEPHVRVYTEERDRPALLLVDQRVSMFFGTQVYMKSVVAAEAAAIAAHRVLAQGDRVGGIVFGDTDLAEHRPQRRPAALRRFLSSLGALNCSLNAGLRPQTTVSLNQVLQQAARIAHTNALVCVFSDFDGLTDGSERLLRRLAHSNDLILFDIYDPIARHMPPELRLTVSDGDQQIELDASDRQMSDRVTQAMEQRLAQLQSWSRRYGFPVVPLTTAEPALAQILRLFGHQRGRS